MSISSTPRLDSEHRTTLAYVAIFVALITFKPPQSVAPRLAFGMTDPHRHRRQGDVTTVLGIEKGPFTVETTTLLAASTVGTQRIGYGPGFS